MSIFLADLKQTLKSAFERSEGNVLFVLMLLANKLMSRNVTLAYSSMSLFFEENQKPLNGDLLTKQPNRVTVKSQS